jgi:outer membrane receptor protein involved in Fe transport
VEKLTISAAYSYIRAVYQTPFVMSSPNNSSRDAADQIAVERGNRIPSIPSQVVKLLADYAPNAQASLGLGWTWFGKQFARGDENNQDAHGPLAGYGIVQAFARYRLDKQWQLSLKVDNLFDRRYQSFGVLGENFFTGPGNSFNPAGAASEQFVTPGAPRALWISLRYETGRL